ncbi:MAG: YceI family protein [Gemmatimonadota bacterium]
MTRKLFSYGALALATLTIAAGPAPVKWNVDVPHTGIEFSVNHFFTPVSGKFDTYEIDLTFDRENPVNSEVEVRIDVNSVNTGNERRDEHLRSEDFFGTDDYQWITFRSESIRSGGNGVIIARGPLTIKDQTHEIELPIRILGVKDIPAEMQQMLGGVTEVASFHTELEIDRGDYGVGTGSWAANVVVGDEVTIEIALEANR